jgi:hypothetical protein
MVWTGFIWLVEQSVILRLVGKCKVFDNKMLRNEIGKINGKFAVHITRNFVIYTAHSMVRVVKSVEFKIDRIYNYNANTRNMEAVLAGEQSLGGRERNTSTFRLRKYRLLLE